MGTKRIKAQDLSEAAIVERSRSLGNSWMFAVGLEHARITKPRPQDKAFHPFDTDSFNEADVHFLAIALRRLRTVASTLEHVPPVWDSIRNAIQIFDEKLPWIKHVRDVFEHLVDYAVDSNLRRTKTSRRELQVWASSETGMQWMGYDIDWKVGLLAANDLFNAIKAAYDSFFKRNVPDNEAFQRTLSTHKPRGQRR
ncbi:MAG: hypothetical protein IPP68_07515 [Elusimicrobia bacterium]|nr:hypothetical protein [Elusimicrobiota bacterium]